MKTSEKINELAAALAKAQAKIKPPAKNRTAIVPTKTGGSYKYSYADLSDIIDAIRGPLSENGLAITSGTESNGHSVLCTRLIHQSGQWIEATYPILDGLSAQQMGSAITYGRRYTTCALVGIVAEDDDDGEAAEGAGAKKQAPPKPAAEKPKEELKQPDPKPDPKKDNAWRGTVAAVESLKANLWKVTGGDTTTFATSTPEHRKMAEDASKSLVMVEIVYRLNQVGSKVIQSMKEVKQ